MAKFAGKAQRAAVDFAVQDYPAADAVGDGEPDEMDPDLRLARFEDLYDYDEYCTFNMDYSMLDHMTEEEIKASHNKKNQ